MLGLGSHDNQQDPDAPVAHLADVVITSKNVDCSMFSDSSYPRNENFDGIIIDFLDLAVGEQNTDGIGRRLTQADSKAYAVGTVEILEASLAEARDFQAPTPVSHFKVDEVIANQT